MDESHVTFKWQDYADNNKTKIMKLSVHEFFRRYLSHILTVSAHPKIAISNLIGKLSLENLFGRKHQATALYLWEGLVLMCSKIILKTN